METKTEKKAPPTLDVPGYIPELVRNSEDVLAPVGPAMERKTVIRDERRCGLCNVMAFEDNEAKSKSHALYRCRKCGNSWGIKRMWIAQYSETFDAKYAQVK